MATLKLRVSGMTCEHCQAKVAKALQKTAGVYSAIVDLRAGEAEIDFNDDAVTTEQLVTAVEPAGYRAKLAGQYAPPTPCAGSTCPGTSVKNRVASRSSSDSPTSSPGTSTNA